MRCPEKVRYRDRIAALLALSRVQGKGHVRDKAAKRVYRCPTCKGWHLTSTQPKPKAAKPTGACGDAHA